MLKKNTQLKKDFMLSKTMKIKILILIILSLFSSWRLFRSGYPSMQDDIQVFRLQQYDQCQKDGQIPCRYISDGGMGYGYPLYNFYSPLPYGVSESFHLIGFSYIDSIKISFIVSIFLKTFGMFLLASTFFGSYGGFLATILYSFAPYQALNLYVRGAIGETWALSLLPLVFWSIYQKKSKLSVLFLSCLLLSHNLTLIYSLPFLAVFSIITKKFKYFFRTLLWSLSISSFFLLPAFFEKNLTTVNTMTQGYFNYIIHFVTLKELFVSNFWGYSASMWGPIDGLSFQIGFFQWIIPTILFVIVLFKTNFKHRSLIILLYLIALLSLFLTHNKSTFIWNRFPFLAYFQFPWRFLGLAIFSLSFISGGIISIFKRNTYLLVTISMALAVLLLNYPNFREDIWYPQLTDNLKLSGNELIRQSGAGLMDYWPKYSTDFPSTFAPSTPIVISGDATVINFFKNSHHSSLAITIQSSEAIINFPIVYFPNWILTVDGQKTSYDIEPTLGLIQTKLTQGNHQIILDFKNTPIRTFANLFSLFAFGSFIILTIREKRS